MKARRLVNLMRYPLNVFDANDIVVSIAPSGQLVGVNEHTQMSVVDFDNIGHVPVAVVESRLDRVPEPTEGIAYVVPMRALLAMHEGGYDVSDIYAPNMLVRDGAGKIVGCRRLMQIPSVKR